MTPDPKVPAAFRLMPKVEWMRRQKDHATRTKPWTAAHVGRRSLGKSHPIFDFLFDYYSYRPSLLSRWHPGIGVALEGDEAKVFLEWSGYRQLEVGVASLPTFPAERVESLLWILDLLKTTRERPPFFGCFGLHEWAMVYRQTPAEVRHNQWPLRLSPEKIAEQVESQPIRCSHHDAFRFFTQPARALNRLQPERPRIRELEQRGCLHVTMDLYKWAIKLSPFTPSELIADCFALAYDVREIDMRASPYDFSRLGFPAIPIETPEGRADYETYQRQFTDRGASLRDQLIEIYEATIAWNQPAKTQRVIGNPGFTELQAVPREIELRRGSL